MSNNNNKDRDLKAIKVVLSQQLTESGEKERLRDELRDKLVASGWRDDMEAHCRQLIAQRGVEHVRGEDIVADLVPYAIERIPQHLRDEVQQRLRDFLAQCTVNID
jgi:enhancer of yellow 2 transcription factor